MDFSIGLEVYSNIKKSSKDERGRHLPPQDTDERGAGIPLYHSPCAANEKRSCLRSSVFCVMGAMPDGHPTTLRGMPRILDSFFSVPTW